MEVNNELIPLVDVDELDAKRNEFSVDTLQSGFNRTVETGLGRSYDHVDRLANDEIIKNLPDYNENKEAYDSYLDLLPEQKDVYRSAIEKGAYTIGSDGEVIAADGITMMGRLLTKKGGFFKEDALKGIILANAQGVTQTTLDDKFKEFHTNNIKKYQNQTFTTAGAAADMIGSLGAYFTEPEIALEIFGVPSRIFGKTIVGNAAKAFGYEAGVASVSEAIRQFKPTGVMALNKRAKVDYTLADGGMQVLVNAGFAGTLRGLGSGIQDTLLLNTIKSRTPDADAYAVFSRWNERQLSKTILNQTAYDVSMRTLSEELNNNRMPEIETDINIMERASPDIQAVNIQEEVRLQRSEMGYNNFAKAFDKEFDAIPTTPIEFKFEDDLVDSFDKLDPEIMNHPEVQQLKKELDAFDTTPETTPPYKLEEVEGILKYSPQGKILISDVIQLEKGTNIQGVRSAIERTQQGKATARDTEIVDAVDNYMRNEGFKHITPEELPKDLIDEGYSLNAAGEFIDPTGKVLFAKGGDNVLAGGIAAIGEDENGNITFDPAKFLAGALGLQVAKKFAPKLFEIADDSGVRIGSGAGGKAPTTGPKNLLVTHNISESSLLKAEQSGGLIAPSLAVIKAEKGGTLKGYGDITLLGKKDLVDPQKNQTTVLSDADIYSPRVPQPIHTVDKKAWDNFVDKYNLDNIFSQNKYKYMKDEEGNREEVLRKVKNDIRLKKDFLNEQGVSIQNKTKLDVSSNLAKDITKKVMTDAGITKKIIDGVNTSDYDIMKKQVTDIYNNIKGELYKNIEPDVRKTLLKNKGYNYDDNGVLTFAAAETLQRDLKNIINNVQKFDERATNIDIDSKFTKERTKQYDTWLDDKMNDIFGYKKLSTGASYTPQNIVDYMFRSGTIGKEEKGIFGNSKNAGEIRAVASRMLTSIEDVTKNKYKLVSYEDMKPIQDDFSNRLFDLTSKMGGDSFDGKEAASKAIFNYAKTGTLSGVKTSFKDDVKKFVNDIKNAETQYFEAKLKRVVKASEFEIAVIPKGTDKKVVDYLKSEGLKIKLYDKSVTGADEDTIIKAATSGKILFMHPAAIAGGLGLGIISQENNKDK